MTGHGQAVRSLASVTINVETRAVNNRFLKIVPKVSKQLGSFENSIESIVRELVRRGSVQVNVTVTGASDAGVYRFNSSVLENYWTQAREIAKRIGAPAPALEALLELPGVIAEPQSEDEPPELLDLASQTLRESILMMNNMRAQEGEAMAVELRMGLDKIGACSRIVADRAPAVVSEYQTRLESKIKRALEGLDVQIDAAAIIREVQIFADRSDIREELVRLASHLTLFRQAMDDRESQGRKLDFLVQEINREINTIGSKASDAMITEQIVLMKTTLEQIRELIQNIE